MFNVDYKTVYSRYRRGLLGLGDYYEESVIGGQRRLVGQCREREARSGTGGGQLGGLDTNHL